MTHYTHGYYRAMKIAGLEELLTKEAAGLKGLGWADDITKLRRAKYRATPATVDQFKEMAQRGDINAKVQSDALRRTEKFYDRFWDGHDADMPTLPPEVRSFYNPGTPQSDLAEQITPELLEELRKLDRMRGQAVNMDISRRRGVDWITDQINPAITGGQY